MGEILSNNYYDLGDSTFDYKWQVIYNGDVVREFDRGHFLEMSKYYNRLKNVKQRGDVVTWRLKDYGPVKEA